MSNNTQAQGRTYRSESDYTFTPLSSDDAFRASNRWEMQLQRQLYVGDVTKDAAAKQARLNINLPVAPVNTVAPVITGTATVGQTLTVNTGTWTGQPAPTFTYAWLVGGVVQAGQTANTFTAVQGSITARVTATNTGGTANVTTAARTVA